MYVISAPLLKPNGYRLNQWHDYSVGLYIYLVIQNWIIYVLCMWTRGQSQTILNTLNLLNFLTFIRSFPLQRLCTHIVFMGSNNEMQNVSKTFFSYICTNDTSWKRVFCFSFSEINECVQFGRCSHYCTNTKGSYKCTCDKNYKDVNGSCIAKGKDLYFVLICPLAPLAQWSWWYFMLVFESLSSSPLHVFAQLARPSLNHCCMFLFIFTLQHNMSNADVIWICYVLTFV